MNLKLICMWETSGEWWQRPPSRFWTMITESRSLGRVCIKGVGGRGAKRWTALKWKKRKIQNKRDWRERWNPLISHFNSQSFQIPLVSPIVRLFFPIFCRSKRVPWIDQQHQQHLELIRNRIPSPSPDLLNHNLHFKIPGCSVCTLKFENHHYQNLLYK